MGRCNMLKHLQFCVSHVETDADFQAALMDHYNNKCKEFGPESMALAELSIIKYHNTEMVSIEFVFLYITASFPHAVAKVTFGKGFYY